MDILLQVLEQCHQQCLEINVSGLHKQFHLYYANMLNLENKSYERLLDNIRVLSC